MKNIIDILFSLWIPSIWLWNTAFYYVEGVGIRIDWILSVLLLISLLIRHFQDIRRLPNEFFWKPVFILILSILVSSFAIISNFSYDRAISYFQAFVQIIVLLSLIPLLYRHTFETRLMKNILRSVCILSVVIALFGIFQSFQSLSGKPVTAPPFFNHSLHSEPMTYAAIYARPFSIYAEPLIFSLMLLFPTVFLFLNLAKRDRPVFGTNYSDFLSLAIFLQAHVSAMSIGVIVVLGTLLMAMLFYIRDYRKAIGILALKLTVLLLIFDTCIWLFSGISLIAIIGIRFYNIAAHSLGTSIIANAFTIATSEGSRIQQAVHALDNFFANPFTGVGLNNYGHIVYEGLAFYTSSSGFLQILSELGLFGLFAALFFAKKIYDFHKLSPGGIFSPGLK